MKNKSNGLAIQGGPKAKTTPYGTGKRFLDNELKNLKEALENNTLFYGLTESKWVKQACEMMKTYTGMPHVVACSSGSAAIHLGLIAAGIGPGDEVIVTPNTDFGTVIGVMEEGAVPVFCDCDSTLQPTAASVAAKITSHTKAVIVVHLAGHPAPVDEIVAVCQPKGIAVIEDCAQSWGARLHGRMVGTFGTAGCYSTNDFKHISTGDGGFVVLADPILYRRVLNYSDKCYDRLFQWEQHLLHHAMNYRMTELQGAVACAQLEKVERITARNHELGERFRERLKPLRGARLMQPIPGGYSTYWWTALFVDEGAVTVSRDQIVKALEAEGLTMIAYAKYDLIETRLFETRVTRPWLSDSRRMYPFVQPDGRSYTYSLDQVPVHKSLLAKGITFSFNRFYTDLDIDETAQGVLKVFEAYAK